MISACQVSGCHIPLHGVTLLSVTFMAVLFQPVTVLLRITFTRPQSHDCRPINRQRLSIKPSNCGFLVFWMACLSRTFRVNPTCPLILQLARESWIKFFALKISSIINCAITNALLKQRTSCFTHRQQLNSKWCLFSDIVQRKWPQNCNQICF